MKTPNRICKICFTQQSNK